MEKTIKIVIGAIDGLLTLAFVVNYARQISNPPEVQRTNDTADKLQKITEENQE